MKWTFRIPKTNLWDSVQTAAGVTRRNWIFRLFCKHNAMTVFTWTDHRSGPGGYSDSYEGTCCVHCGTIIKMRQTF